MGYCCADLLDVGILLCRSEKQRAPAYTDRVLYRAARAQIAPLFYESVNGCGEFWMIELDHFSTGAARVLLRSQTGARRPATARENYAHFVSLLLSHSWYCFLLSSYGLTTLSGIAFVYSLYRASCWNDFSHQYRPADNTTTASNGMNAKMMNWTLFCRISPCGGMKCFFWKLLVFPTFSCFSRGLNRIRKQNFRTRSTLAFHGH